MSKVDSQYFSRFEDIKDTTFDYVVIGGGAYGTSFVWQLLQQQPNARVLVLDKGDYLIPDHIQNLPPAYINLNTTTGIRPWLYQGTDNLNFMPQIPYIGGRALFWNAWTPQPDDNEMPDWPEQAKARLNGEWAATGEFMGVRTSLAIPGNENQSLQRFMRERLFSQLANINGAMPQSDPLALDSAMATGQGVAREQWAKFSPISVLVDLVQNHSQLKVVGQAEVVRLVASGHQVTSIETQAGKLAVGDARVILACNTLEAGFILTRSFPQDPLVGKNLCGHIRSWLAARIPAASLPALTKHLQAVAYYLPGQDKNSGRLMHTHISVVHNPQPQESYDLLYRILPDASTKAAVDTYQEPGYVVIMLHSMGEFLGAQSSESWNAVSTNAEGKSQVIVEMQQADKDFWAEMDQTTYDVMTALAGDAPLEYQYNHPDGSFSWSSTRPDPALLHNKGLVHEAGTLWMGDDPATSVTASNGQMHRYHNVYGLGSMLFPRPGSFNPTLTGVAQAFALAKELAVTGKEHVL